VPSVPLWRLFLYAFVALASSAPRAAVRVDVSEAHMGTTFRIVLYASDEPSGRIAAERAFAQIARLDQILTDYEPTSELSRATREAVGHPIHVSNDLLEVLVQSQDLARRSDGAFDITVGPLTRLWRRARREVELPATSDLEAARRATGFRLLHLDAAARTVEFDRPGMQLDAGGIAKGFAADQALRVLVELGSSRAIVAAGGDIAIGDPPPDRPGWDIALAGLENAPAPGSPLTLSHAGVSTSGDAEQWVEIGGVRYSHILDPRTGQPITGRSSVTVVAGNATTSDMLATAVDVLGPEAGRRLVDGWAGASALIGTRDGTGDHWVTSRRFP
jgi:thiamine biosynthesis lipoprotein